MSLKQEVEHLTANESVAELAPWRGWANVIVLFIALTIIFGGAFMTFGLFFPPLVGAFHWSHTEVALLITIQSLVVAGISPLVGTILERIEARFVIALGAVVAIAAYIIASRAHSYPTMIIAYALLGIAMGCGTFIPGPMVVAQWFSKNRGLAMGIVIAGAPFGGLVMTEVIGRAIDGYGWRDAYLVIAAMTLVLVIPLALIVVRNTPAHHVEHDTEGAAAISGYKIREGFGTRALWFLILAAFCYGFIVALGLAHLVEYLTLIGFSASAAHGVYALLSLTAFIGCLLAGWIGDVLGNRAVITAALFLMMVALLALLQIRNSALMGLFMFGYGFNGAAPTALLMLVLAEAVGLRHFAFFSGLVSFAMTLGNAAGPVVAGRIFDVTHSYFEAFVLGAAVALLAAVFIIALPKLRFAGAHEEPAPASPAPEPAGS